jgi:hypothetical protein
MGSQGQVLTANRAQIMWLRCKDSLANMIGWCLEKSKAPAVLKEFEFVDPETNETIYLATGHRYTVLHVRGKRFFFHRVSGVLDGTCTSLQERVPNGFELRD